MGDEAAATARKILELRERYRTLLGNQGKASGNFQLTLDKLFTQPAVSAASLAKSLDVSYVTANNVISKFVELKILDEATGNKRNRKFLFSPYLDLFADAGQELASPEPTQTKG